MVQFLMPQLHAGAGHAPKHTTSADTSHCTCPQRWGGASTQPRCPPHIIHCPATNGDQNFEVGILLFERHRLAVQLALIVPLHRLE